MHPLMKRLVVRPLTLRERAWCFYAGAKALPWSNVAEFIRAATLRTPDSPTEDDRTAASSLASLDDGELDHEINRTRRGIAEAERKRRGAIAELPGFVASRPALTGPILWALFGLAILGGDAAYTLQAILDAIGGDMSEGLQGTPPFVLALGVLMAALACLVNCWAGVRATDPRSAFTRWGGWALLVGCGLVLAILRGSASAEASFALTLFGFIIPIVAGAAAGSAKHQLAKSFAELAKFKNEERGRELALKANAAERAELERRLALVAERKRGVAPNGPVRRRRAAEREEHAQFLKSRLAAARGLYQLGAKLAGRAASRGEDNDA